MELIADVKPLPRMPAWPIRCGISLVVVAHFSAIAVAVTSISTPNYPASPLSVAASEHLQPYLQATLFNNAYRFFAPNPGLPTLFWMRIENGDGTVRWVELPGEPESTIVRAPYQRRVNMGLQFGSQLLIDKDSNGRARFTPLAESWLSSLVRHIRRQQTQSTPGDVASVDMYVLIHNIVTPEQVRDGWTPTDLRTYRIMPLGAFDADGRRISPEQPIAEQSMAQIVGRMVAMDVHPRLRQMPRDAVLEPLPLPSPAALFIKAHPELLNPALPVEEIAARIDLVLAGVQ